MSLEPSEKYVALIEKIQPHFAEYGFCGFDIPQGWIFLISQLHDRIESHVPDYVLVQAKEKFGGLRFYVEFPSEDISDGTVRHVRGVIDEYEIRSLTTCQGCGDINARQRDAGWVATLCDPCFDLVERGYW